MDGRELPGSARFLHQRSYSLAFGNDGMT